MNKLNKMLIRDMLKSKSQFIAAIMIIFSGVTVFAATYMSYKNLENSFNFYYEEYNFLDYYADVNEASHQAIESVKNISGVKEVIGRIGKDIGADMGNSNRVTLRMISIPDNQEPKINRLFFVSGRYFDNSNNLECFISGKFANFHNISVGETIKTIINNKVYEFKIAGIVGSPEYIYATKSDAAMFPNAEDFGIIYAKESTVKNILGYDDTFNQIHFLFERGNDEEKIIDDIEKELRPYGFLRGIKRADQRSNFMIVDDIGILEKVSFIFPVLFLSIAAMIVYVVQKRIIDRQRTLIGVMKALGYSDNRIIIHYLLTSIIISTAGAIPAIFSGYYLSIFLTKQFVAMYGLESIEIRMYGSVFAIGYLLSATFSLLASYNSTKSIVKIEPAQAMRSKSPELGSKIFIENISFIWKRMSFSWKMSVRNIFRSKQRSLAMVLGLASTIMLFIGSVSFTDSMNWVTKDMYFNHKGFDYKLYFSNPASLNEVRELERIDGIFKSEPLLEVPIEIKNGWIEKESMITGLTKNQSLINLYSDNQKNMSPYEHGIFMAEELAKGLKIEKNDEIIIKPLLEGYKEKRVKVKEFVDQYSSFSSFVDIKELGNILGEGEFANTAVLKIDKTKGEHIKKELLKYSNIETIENKVNDYKVFVDEMLSTVYAFISFMILFSSIMGFAIVFNITLINISDRNRELASLKVLGYSDWEINIIIIRENIILGIIAIIPGIFLGNGISTIFTGFFTSELFVLKKIILPHTYAIAIFSIFVFIFIAQIVNKKKISKLNIIEVLKNRE